MSAYRIHSPAEARETAGKYAHPPYQQVHCLLEFEWLDEMVQAMRLIPLDRAAQLFVSRLFRYRLKTYPCEPGVIATDTIVSRNILYLVDGVTEQVSKHELDARESHGFVRFRHGMTHDEPVLYQKIARGGVRIVTEVHARRALLSA